MGWRNRWCQLTWTREAEFKLCIQFQATDCINSQACLQENAKGINLLLSNTNQDSYPMQFIKSYVHAYLYIHVHSQPHFIFCPLYKEVKKSLCNKTSYCSKALFFPHINQLFSIICSSLFFYFYLFVKTTQNLFFFLDFLPRKEQTFEIQGKLWPL